MADQFEQEFIQAEEDPTAEGHRFRGDFGKMLVNSLKDTAPGGGNEVLVAAVEKALNATLPGIQAAIVGQVVSQIVTRLTSDPGPEATLLYERIANGVWEQLAKFGDEVGYKAPHA